MNCSTKYKVIVLFNFFLHKYDKETPIGELSLSDMIKIVELLTNENENAKN